MTQPQPPAGLVADEPTVHVEDEFSTVRFADCATMRGPFAGELRSAFERLLSVPELVGGDEVTHFEQALAGWVGTSFAVGVASGTAALLMALRGAGIGPGDEVVVPAYGPFATISAVFAAGATPVLADVDSRHGLLDPHAVEAALSSRTAAIVCVHLYGQPATMDVFHHIAQHQGLFLLEDATQAMGATWNGRPVGTLGRAAALSFRPGGTLPALGDAGAVTTDDVELADAVRLLRNLGSDLAEIHWRPGLDERLDELQAAFLSATIPHLSETQRFRLEAVGRYRADLAGTDEVRFLDVDPRAGHAYQMLVLRVPRRDQVLGALRATGVEARVHYRKPIHLQPACEGLGYQAGQFPNAEVLGESVLSLPLYPGISAGQVEQAAEAVKRALAVTA